MSDRKMNPIDDLLSQLADDFGPTEAVRERARADLAEVIASEAAPRGQRWKGGWKRPVLTAGAITVGLIIAVSVTQAPNPAPAQAALLEIARAAELVEASSIPAQAYAYTYSEPTHMGFLPEDMLPGRGKPFAALFPQIRETWSGDGIFQIRTTHLTPTFFSDQDEEDFYAAGLDDINDIGETITGTYDVSSFEEEVDWSHDPVELLRQIKVDNRGWTTQADIVDSLLQVLRETGASPALRSSVLRVISTLDGVTILDQTASTTTFQIEYRDRGAFQREFVLDATGQLLADRLLGLDGDPDYGIPPNITWSDTTYRPTIIVDDLTTP